MRHADAAMNATDRGGVIRLVEAEARIPGPVGERAVLDRFDSGDILFVAAGVEHHYEDFSDDLALWRIFYGPRGGEIPV